jgi:hypothetical protein
MPRSKFRDWLAVAAHFRRGGAMKHKNTPRGGAGSDPEIVDGLDEYQTDEARKAAEALMKATPEELGRAAVNQGKKELQDEEEEQNVESDGRDRKDGH